MMNGACDAIDGLTDDELHFRAHENCNSIGFEAWHVFRTAGDIVHFVFEREQPVWLQQGLHEQWELPKVAQDTGWTRAMRTRCDSPRQPRSRSTGVTCWPRSCLEWKRWTTTTWRSCRR